MVEYGGDMPLSAPAIQPQSRATAIPWFGIISVYQVFKSKFSELLLAGFNFLHSGCIF